MLPHGRANWACQRVIYPGWWNWKITGVVGGPATIDGARTSSPSVVRMNNKVRLYYWAEYISGGTTYSNILLVESATGSYTNFNLKPVAFTIPSSLPVTPASTAPAEGFYNTNVNHCHVHPALDANGDPKMTGGVFDPWFMYFTTSDYNTGVAKSTDGGLTFTLVANKNAIFPFEVYQVRNTAGVMEWRRNVVASKSKSYDFGGTGSVSVVKDGLYKMFYTAIGKRNHTYADFGVTASDVGHPSGSLADIGIAYADSPDGVTWTRRTAAELGVTSSASDGGRLITPRKWVDGAYEYIVSKPLVFWDSTQWRMMVSTHSTAYRVRTLTSPDLINWTWESSPADGVLGLGASGEFDDEHVAYADVHRVGNTYHCYYTGNGYGHYSNNPTGIGYATATI